MEKQTIEAMSVLALSEERTRLVRFCASITKNGDVAEDLAQETLLEAWRNEHTLRDPQRRSAWLLGIARNICLRWLRLHKRDMEHLSQPHLSQDLLETETIGSEIEDILADDLDIEIALERKELIELLDRALSLLPVETRTLLIQRYVEVSPLAEIAAQMGTNANAVAMRLQRGKLVLRRILVNEIGEDLPLYVAHAATDEWEKTPLWCYSCEHCGSSWITSLESLILEAAQGQQFLQAHPRIRTLPRQYLQIDGRAAILTRFESVTNTATLDIISDEETYEILRVYGGAL